MHCSLYFLVFTVLIGTSLTEEVSNSNDGITGVQSDYYSVREPRSYHKKKLCRKYGICESHGDYQGGHQGGYQQGYQGGYPINIAISQSQSSSNGADGGYSQGYNPSNYQYNQGNGYGGYPNQGYGGYPNQGYGGYPNQGYGGYKPGYYGNGQGAYNNQFNGNYYGGFPQGGGYGFQKPFGNYYDEDGSHEEENEGGFAFARSAAVAESKA